VALWRLASLFSISQQTGISGGDALKTLVFLTILADRLWDSQQAGSLVGSVFAQIKLEQWFGQSSVRAIVGSVASTKGEEIALIDLDPSTASQAQLDEIPTLSRCLSLEDLKLGNLVIAYVPCLNQ